MAKNIDKRRVDWILSASALLAAYMGYIQIRHYPLTFLPIPPTDLAGFYTIRFSDGQSHWPFETYSLQGSEREVLPIEYPVLIGLIVWVTSFISIPGLTPKVAYVTANAFLIGILFVIAINGLSRITNRAFTKYVLLSPVIILSLYLNWDLWAIAPLVYSIVLFEAKKYLTPSTCDASLRRLRLTDAVLIGDI